MDYRVDQQALRSLSATAGQLPTLQAPVPPELEALAARLALPPEAEALGVPAGCYSALPSDLLRRLMALVLPPISLVGGIPTISALANLHFLATVRLGFPLPNRLVLLAQLMEQLDLRDLSFIAHMPWGPLSRLALLVRLGELLRVRLGINPGQIDASAAIAATLPTQVPAFGIAMPAFPPPLQMTLRLGYALKLQMLLSLCETLGVTLGGPGGIPSLSLQLRMLFGVRLPVLQVLPSLLPNLYLLAEINAIWPLTTIAMNIQPFRLHIAALLKLQVPTLPSCLGPSVAMDLAKMPPPMPTAQTIEKILSTDFSEIAKVDWKIPDVAPIAPALPGLNALVQLQDLAKVLKPV